MGYEGSCEQEKRAISLGFIESVIAILTKPGRPCSGKVLALLLLLYPPDASGGYFGLAFATPPPLPPPRVERFSALTL